MRGAGHNNYQPDLQRQSAYREKIAQQRDFSYDEIVSGLPIELAREADLYQINDLRQSTVPTSPWPAEWESQHPAASELLQFNVGVYDDEIEDLLYQDKTLIELLEMRKLGGNDETLVQTIRARRSILLRILLDEIATFEDGDKITQ